MVVICRRQGKPDLLKSLVNIALISFLGTTCRSFLIVPPSVYSPIHVFDHVDVVVFFLKVL